MLKRLFKYTGYSTVDVKVSSKDKTVKILLERKSNKAFNCHRCSSRLERLRGHHRYELNELPVMDFKTIVMFWRYKGWCSKCQKTRNEHADFIAKESPHYTQKYAWWLGEMCEFSTVKQASEFNGICQSALRNIDYKRMRKMLQKYKIPEVRWISVDEVYARRKSHYKGESRNSNFFTVITDLDTRKVVWVSDSRDKKGLDEFFLLIGREACSKIKVVAMDQHEAYRASVNENCPNADVVWDRFHIMQTFNEAVNDTRKHLHSSLDKDDPIKPLTRGKYRFVFTKNKSSRTSKDQKHLESVFKMNSDFFRLELIREAMVKFFESRDESEAKEVLDQITYWIYDAKFIFLKRWVDKFHSKWGIAKNYFKYRVTTAVSEGINNVIKAVKRQAFGFRNMDYFKLKIMQRCGYLNSKFINDYQQLA